MNNFDELQLCLLTSGIACNNFKNWDESFWMTEKCLPTENFKSWNGEIEYFKNRYTESCWILSSEAKKCDSYFKNLNNAKAWNVSLVCFQACIQKTYSRVFSFGKRVGFITFASADVSKLYLSERVFLSKTEINKFYKQCPKMTGYPQKGISESAVGFVHVLWLLASAWLCFSTTFIS